MAKSRKTPQRFKGRKIIVKRDANGAKIILRGPGHLSLTEIKHILRTGRAAPGNGVMWLGKQRYVKLSMATIQDGNLVTATKVGQCTPMNAFRISV